MPMNPRLLRPVASAFHPEAQVWRNAVIANGGTVSGSTLKAVSDFCKSIDQAGIRDRLARVNLVCGTGLNAALVPLYRGFSRTGTQYGNATDTNNGPFVSADYVESSGLKGNATSKDLDTGLGLDVYGLGNSHLSVSFTELEASGGRGLITGSGFVASNFTTIQSDGTNLQGFHCSFTALTTAQAASQSHLLLSRTSTTSAKLYTSGSVAATSTASVSPSSSSATYRLFGRQDSGTFVIRTAMRLRMYSLGLGLSDSQASAFATAVAAFNTALGR
jgi:hypothetical protein